MHKLMFFQHTCSNLLFIYAIKTRDELATLRQSEEFKVQFPTLSQPEFMEHCIVTTVHIKCDLNGTSLVDNFREICEDASGKVVPINVQAAGSCVDFVNVTFYGFPTCAGRSCNDATYIEAYEQKLKLESSLVGENCVLDLTSGGSFQRSSYIVTIMTISVVLLGVML